MSNMYWSAERDDYGRSTHVLISDGRVAGVVVCLPKCARTPGRTHFANNYGDPVGTVTDHASLAAAKNHLAAAVAA